MEVAIKPKVKCYLIGDKRDHTTDSTVTGYLIPYTGDAWNRWFKQFTFQSACEYTIHTSLQENQKSREVDFKGHFILTNQFGHVLIPAYMEEKADL